MRSHSIPPFHEGQRVEFGAELERSPHFTVPAGATAVVEYVDEQLLTVQLEEPVAGLEHSGNQVDFRPEEFATAVRILRVLAED